MDTVCAPEVRLQVPGQLGIGGEGLLTQLALELLHMDKLDVVPQGLGHDEAVGTLGKLGVVNSLVMDSELSHVTECFVTGFTPDIPASGLSDILGDIFQKSRQTVGGNQLCTSGCQSILQSFHKQDR